MTYRKTLFLIAGFSLFIFVQAYMPLSAYSSEKGKAIFASKDCADCHSLVRGKLNKKGPELWYAGSKFKDGFLDGWLAAPVRIRPMAYRSITEKNRDVHPVLISTEAREVAAYLATFKSAKVKALGITSQRTFKGRVIFEKKGACYGCHEVRKGKLVLGGKSGPSLENAGARLRADWIYAYLNHPLYFFPDTAMPLYHKSINKKDMKTLSAYVAALRSLQ